MHDVRYGDTQVIRALAHTLRKQGHQIQEEAHELLRAADATPWIGRAADAMRASTQRGAAALGRTADLHDQAARALEGHADNVDRLEHLIAAIEDAVMAMVAQAKQRLHGLPGLPGVIGALGSVLPDWVDDVLDRFDPPPSGHRDWLSVRLPFHVPGLPLPSLIDQDLS